MRPKGRACWCRITGMLMPSNALQPQPRPPLTSTMFDPMAFSCAVGRCWLEWWLPPVAEIKPS